MLPGACLPLSQGLSRRWHRVFGLAVGGLLLFFLSLTSAAQAGVLDLAWDAPTTNSDGTALTDLSAYRVYSGTSSAPCPGSSYQVVDKCQVIADTSMCQLIPDTSWHLGNEGAGQRS